MKLNKYLSTLLGGVMLLGAWGCTDKIEPEPNPAYDGDDVYFSTTDNGEVDIPMDASEVSVTIYRVKADDEITVGLSSAFYMVNDDNETVEVKGIFSAPASVTFLKDEKSVKIPVKVDFTQVEPAVDYYMNMTIEGDLTSAYGEAEKVFTLTYSPWTKWDYYENEQTTAYIVMNGLLSGDWDGQIFYRESIINPNLSQFIFDGTGMVMTLDKSQLVDVDGKKYPMVILPETDLEMQYQGEELFAADSRTFLLDMGYQPGTEDWNKRWSAWSLADSYYNTDTGVFHIFIVYYFGNSLYPPSESFIYMPGFADYSFEFSYLGNFVTASGTELAVVNISHSQDVNSFVYGATYGKLDAAEVKKFGEALASDTELELIYEASKDVTVACGEDGDYTVVAVGYDDKGAAVVVDSFTFKYESVQKESQWESKGYVAYTDGMIMPLFGNDPVTYEVAVEEHVEYPGYFRLVNPYADYVDDQTFFSTGTDGYIYLNATNPDYVYMETSPLGVYSPAFKALDNAELYLGSVPEYYLTSGADPDKMLEAGMFATVEDNVITFPAQTEENSWLYAMTSEALWTKVSGYPVNTEADVVIEFLDIDYPAQAAPRKAPSFKANAINAPVKRVKNFLGAAKAKNFKKAQSEEAVKAVRENLTKNAVRIF